MIPLLSILNCQKVEEQESEEFGLPEIVNAYIEFGDTTKTAIDNYGNVLWTSSDNISIFYKYSINSRYVIKKGVGTTSASFKLFDTGEFVSGAEIPYNVAYYPYDEGTWLMLNEDGIPSLCVTLPSVQKYAENSFGRGAYPMLAVTTGIDDMRLGFKNILSLIKLQLTGKATINKIEFLGNNDEVLCGKGTITAVDGEGPTVSLTDTDENAKKITLYCDYGVKLNSEPTSFVIGVPPIELANGFTIKIYANNGATMEIKNTNSRVLLRNTILPFEPLEFKSNGTSDGDANALLTDMYAVYLVKVAGTEGIDNPEQVMLNYPADDVLAGGGNFQDHAPFRYFCEFSYDNTNSTLKSAYDRYYHSIHFANLVISRFTDKNTNQVDPNSASDFTKQAVAEARVMRAYLQLMLALSWNCPPIFDHVLDKDEIPANAESQSAILDWVIAECESAISSGSLPKRNGTGDKDATARMSVGFAQFIAGKAALFNNDPTTAVKYLGDLIDSGDYALVPSEDYWTNFHISGDGSVEKIFEPNFKEDPAYTNNAWGYGQSIYCGRWMVANVLCWRTDALASQPLVHDGFQGWNGGAIQEDFAKKFLDHDGNSPRRRACFLTGDEFLYEMDWNSELNDATLAEKKVDNLRGIASANGLFSHGPYFEWKHMVYINPPKILTGGKGYPSDNVKGLGAGSNQKNFNVARYAEALLLYAEACIGTGDATKGLAALNAVQTRSGSGKISSELTIQDVIEEKQYEMWFENCRFHDLVRWSKLGYVNLDDIFNTSGIFNRIPTVYDAFFKMSEAEHRLFVEYSVDPNFSGFQVGKHEYYPLPHDYTIAYPDMTDVDASNYRYDFSVL